MLSVQNVAVTSFSVTADSVLTSGRNVTVAQTATMHQTRPTAVRFTTDLQ